MNGNAKKESIVPEVNDSISTGISAVTGYGLDYIRSKAALATLEAKMAATSIALMLILGLFCVVLLCAVWGLGCFALVHWLTLSGLLTDMQALGALVSVNVVVLLIVIFIIYKLSESLLFENTLDKQSTKLKASQ